MEFFSLNMDIMQRVDDMLDLLPSDNTEDTADDTRKRKLTNQGNTVTKKRKLENGTAASSNDSNPVKLESSTLLNFAYLLGNLKKTERTGWVRCGVHQPESIADHMYRMGILSWVFGAEFDKYSDGGNVKLDKNKVIKMAIVHDIIESICGDIVPIEKISGISKEKKHEIELNAMIKIRDEYLKGSAVGHEMYELWMEYEEQKCVESHIVKDLDKLDMIIQAEEYEKDPKNKGIDLAGFFKGTRGVFQTEIGKSLDKELMEQRQKRLSSKNDEIESKK